MTFDLDQYINERSRVDLVATVKRQGLRIIALEMELDRLREALQTISDAGEPFAADHAQETLEAKAWA